MKRKISVLLLIVLIFNFIFANCRVSAIDASSDYTYSRDSYDSYMESGATNLDGTTKLVSNSTSSIGSSSGVMASMLISIPSLFATFMTNLSTSGGLYHTDSDYSTANTGFFTIQALVFGEYLLFDGKIYQKTSDLNPEAESTFVIKIMDGIKGAALSGFELIQAVSLVAFLIVFILIVGAIVKRSVDDSNNTSLTNGEVTMDTALRRERFKELIKALVLGFLFVFFVKYIAVACFTITDGILDSLWALREALENARI